MSFFDLFFDRRCKLCGKEIRNGAVCADCNERLKSVIEVRSRCFGIGNATVKGTYLFDYDNADVKRLLFALKHRADKDLFLYAAELYRLCLPENFTGMVTCCPRGARSKRNYGYDQVAAPLKLMCKASGGSLSYERLIKRRGFSKEQKRLNLLQRRKNTLGKFRVTKKDIPKNILLFDDVVTSGSTALACADAILEKNPDVSIAFAFLASRSAFSGK